MIVTLSFTLFLSCSVFAIDRIGTTGSISIRLNSVLEDQLNEMVANSNELRGTNRKLQISQIMKISDFDGNTYTLVECAPSGYMIYHDASGIFVESSPVVNSPFYGNSGTYKYVGPNEYYIIDSNSVCRDVLSDTVVDVAILSNLAEKSDIINQTLVANKNDYILDYVNSKSNVSLRFYENLTEERIGEIYGITQQAVSKRIGRIIEKIKKLLRN